MSAPAPVALTVSTSGALTSLGVAMEAVTDAAGAAVCRVTLKNVAADPLSLPSSGAVALGMTVPPTQVAWSVSVTSSVPEKIRTPSKGSTQLSGVSATIAAASGKAMVGTSKCGLSLMPSVFENTAADFTDSGFHVSNALCSVCEAPQPESVWGFQLSLTRSLGGMICVYCMARWCCACFDHAGCWPCRHASNPGRHQAEPPTSFECGASWSRVARWRRTVCVPSNGARASASMQGKRGEAATVCPASHARHRACGRIAKDSVESKPTAPAAAACVARGRRDTR